MNMKYLKYGVLALLSGAVTPTFAATPTFPSVGINGTSSGVITIKPGAAAAGTYNFNLPSTAGTAGQVLTSGGGGSATMTWGAGGGGSGTVTSVGGTSTGGTLTATGGPVTTSGSLNFDLNLSHANVWSGQQTFTAPILGTPASGVATNLTGTAAGLTAGTATVANGLKSATTTVAVNSATAPTAGQVLTATSGTAADWETLTASAVSITPGTTTVVGSTAPCFLENSTSTTLACAAVTTGNVTALGIATGSGGAPVLINGVGGTPSSMTATNLTGTAASLTAGTATVANGIKSATTTVSVSAATAPTNGQVLTATNGSTATWQSPTAGSVSVTAATPNVVITPSPGTASFTIGTTTPINTQSGSSYTIVSGDLAKTVVRSASGAQTDIVPAATTPFSDGATFDLQTLTNGDTLAPITSTANGLASIKLGARQFSEWSSAGGNWNVLLGLPQPATQTGSTYLRDDMTWQVVSASASSITPGTTTVAGATAPCSIVNTTSTTMGCIPYGLTGNTTLVQTTSGGLLTASILPKGTNAAFGAAEGDGVSFTLVAGVGSTLTTDATHGGSFTLTIGAQDTLTASGTVTIPTLASGQSVLLMTAAGATATLTRPGGVTLANVLSQTTLGPLSFMSCAYNSATVYDCMASSQIVTDEICATWDSTTAVTAQTIDFPVSWSSYTVSKVKTKVAGGGSFTVGVKIGGTNVTSCSAISVSGSTNTNTSCTAANTGVVDDIVSVVVSAPSGTVNQAYVCPVFAHAVN